MSIGPTGPGVPTVEQEPTVFALTVIGSFAFPSFSDIGTTVYRLRIIESVIGATAMGWCCAEKLSKMISGYDARIASSRVT